jgi:hypothetical protein
MFPHLCIRDQAIPHSLDLWRRGIIRHASTRIEVDPWSKVKHSARPTSDLHIQLIHNPTEGGGLTAIAAIRPFRPLTPAPACVVKLRSLSPRRRYLFPMLIADIESCCECYTYLHELVVDYD